MTRPKTDAKAQLSKSVDVGETGASFVEQADGLAFVDRVGQHPQLVTFEQAAATRNFLSSWMARQRIAQRDQLARTESLG